MTSLDAIDLDEMQDLSLDEQNILSTVTPRPSVQPRTATITWYPIILAVFVTLLAFAINTEWVQTKVQDIPYSRFALNGILFSLVLLGTIFVV